jgi:uncharacterized membrane protein
MSTNPNQNQQPDPSTPRGGYGGYSGYNPPNPADDPYNAGQQQQQAGAGSQHSDPNYVYGQGGQQYSGGQQQQQQYGTGQQQSNTYVPPSSVGGNYAGQTSSSTDKVARRTAVISYLGLCFTGIVVLFLGRKNRFIQFHAAQSVVVFTPLVIAYVILHFIAGILGGIWIVGWILASILGLVTGLIGVVLVVLWLFLMWQAYRGSMFRLPIAANYADALIARFSRRNNTNI